MNNVQIIGRLVKDPEIKHTEEGKTIATFNIAIDDPHSKGDRADFFRVSIFGNQADLCWKYLRKGFLAGVSGRLRSDQYTDKEGVRRYPVVVIGDRVQFLQWPDATQNKEATPADYTPSEQGSTAAAEAAEQSEELAR